MQKIKFKKNMIIGISIIIAVILYGLFSKSINNDIKNVLDDCEYSVGTVKVFSMQGVRPSLYFRYVYDVDGIEFVGSRYSNMDRSKGQKDLKIGDKYIVAYSNKNAKNSVMLFKYPIIQDSDFERYIKELGNKDSAVSIPR